MLETFGRKSSTCRTKIELFLDILMKRKQERLKGEEEKKGEAGKEDSEEKVREKQNGVGGWRRETGLTPTLTCF